MQNVINEGPMKSRTRRTRQQIEELLAEFNGSECTVSQFCRLHHISNGTFHKWQGRLKNKRIQKNLSAGFAEVQVRSSFNAALFAEVKGIRIYQPVAAAYLKELLA